ncbi:enoyl-CoA hydratase-related protein [Actinoplanes awajinensis]|uniref:enoyl-CoA hydratase-related protein n=1 Tax=Actinoplanes awajinensis TaxID=135946 RepID=UPI00082FF410|nr:enoyl-CoA hydratase-related protein [Actinoplanes awajinensis]
MSAFNGLSQRAWCTLRDAGHDVGVLLATTEAEITAGVRAAAPDLIVCPFLKDRVPAQVWQQWRTVIIHPGPVGDRGPSSLDWAISEGAARWGVTALQAVEEMDAGPIWATRTFPMPAGAPRKSALYNGPVADAAVQCILEVVAKAADPAFLPVPAEAMPVEVPGARLRPPMRQPDRGFAWNHATLEVVRAVRAADGSPGMRTTVAGRDVYAYDAHPGPAADAVPGTLLGHHEDAVLVATGDGSVWLGHLRAATAQRSVKLPATTVLAAELAGVPATDGAPRRVRYRREGPVGWVEFDFYNGAMARAHCDRLLTVLRHAAAQDTTVLVLISGTDAFSNGIHLNVAEAAADPAAAAWANIRAINDVCREILGCAGQTVVAGYAGSAGAGGVMLGLGADVVAARAGIVLNPYYDIGLYGSELHTLTLQRRVGAEQAARLLDEKLPVSAEQALGMGLVDQVGPRDPDEYRAWLTALAGRCAAPPEGRYLHDGKRAALARDWLPVEAYEARELAEMSHDMFADRSGFAAARHAFVAKTRPAGTPDRLTLHPAPAPAPVKAVAAKTPRARKAARPRADRVTS